MKTLLIDNYDSFTFNLFQLLAEVGGTTADVARNDEISIEQVRAGGYDNIVISPGPGTPGKPEDFGVCAAVLAEETLPVLGVCLGHQGLCFYNGGLVDYAPEVMHGRSSGVYHQGLGIFKDIPSPFSAVRYHSLVARDVPNCLEPIAWTADDVLMAVRHVLKPHWGVQFHPESICTEHGAQLIRNFFELTEQHWWSQGRRLAPSHNGNGRATAFFPHGRPFQDGQADAGLQGRPSGNGRAAARRIRHRKLAFYPDSEATYGALFASSSRAFWLDSSLVVPGLSRFSYMGECTPFNGEHVTYELATRTLEVYRQGEVSTLDEDIFSYLSRRVAEMRVDSEGLPFPFPGGYVGYLGYELKAVCGAHSRYQSQSTEPDAMFVLADRFVVFDHEEEAAYLVGVEGPDSADAEAWFDRVEEVLRRMRPPAPWTRASRTTPVDVALRHNPSEYLARIDESLREIREGNTYEVCLTNQMRVAGRLETLNCYRALRSINPAPYSAYLNFPGLTVLCSSPERFLTVDRDRWVESKPIKGTFPRGQTPEEDAALKHKLGNSEKDRSENLMIIDLLRNDLGSVCEIGTVHVPKLFDVESYATVHQLVSTIRGRLPESCTAVECARAAFPGGSMTGAPKIRTMEIIDRLEDGPRGIYSGAIGYFGLDGSADLNIVIRTMVATADRVTIGVGGAIVALSDPEGELEETYLKAKALLKTLEATLPDRHEPAPAITETEALQAAPNR